MLMIVEIHYLLYYAMVPSQDSVVVESKNVLRTLPCKSIAKRLIPPGPVPKDLTSDRGQPKCIKYIIV